MDVNALHGCFASTLAADVNMRTQAEQQLRQAEEAPGFCSGCMDIVLEPRVEPTVRVAAAVYLKNTISRRWLPIDGSSVVPVAEDEKPAFRLSILPALVKLSGQTRAQITAVLNLVVAKDYPKRWPECVDQAVALVQSSDASEVRSGLTCLLEIMRYYRWISGEARHGLSAVVGRCFDGLCQLALQLVNQSAGQSQQDLLASKELQIQDTERAEIVRDVIKCFKMATYRDMPEGVAGTPERAAAWSQLFVQIVSRPLPDYVLQVEDVEMRERHGWCKCKKWALSNTMRTHASFIATQSNLASRNEYARYTPLFVNECVPRMLQVLLEQFEGWAQGQLWQSRAVLAVGLGLFEQAVESKKSNNWKMLRPHVEALVKHVVFPLMVPTDEALELFADEPQEYILRYITSYSYSGLSYGYGTGEERRSPDVSAEHFVVSLAAKRRTIALPILLSLVEQVAQEHSANRNDEALARKMDGAIRVLGAVGRLLVKKPKGESADENGDMLGSSKLAAQADNFLLQNVWPDLSSPHQFLRTRALVCVSQFAELENSLTNQDTLATAYQAVLASVSEGNEVAVRVAGAVALLPLLSRDPVRQALTSVAPQLAKQLLQLGSVHDSDAITNTLKELVEVFSNELAPFAEEVAMQLRDQFLRLAQELRERQKEMGDDGLDVYEDDALEEKTMTGLGILTTLCSLVLAAEHGPAVVARLEAVCLPIFAEVLNSDSVEFFSETFQLIESLTYCSKLVSPAMWDVHGALHHTATGVGLDYLDEIMPCFDNILHYGAPDLVAHPDHVDLTTSLITRVLSHENDARLGAIERRLVCELAQRLMLAMKGRASDTMASHVKAILDLVVDRLRSDESASRAGAYSVSLFSVIAAALLYDTPLTISVLQAHGPTATSLVINVWLSRLKYFSRVYDKKLTALALLSILTVDPAVIPVSVHPLLSSCGSGLVSMLSTLPEALKRRAEAAQEWNNMDDNGYGWNDDDDDSVADDDDDDDDDDYDNGAQPQILPQVPEVATHSNTFINTSSAVDIDSIADTDDIEEDPLIVTALDGVDVHATVHTMLEALSQQPGPQLALLVAALDSDPDVRAAVAGAKAPVSTTTQS